MPKLTISEEIPRADGHEVWQTVVDIQSYPTFMDLVLAVDVLENSHEDGVARRKSAWSVLFNGNELKWVQSDTADAESRELVFDQIEGDLSVWRGRTRVTSEPSGTRITYEIEFDLGVPALARLLHPLAERAIRSSCGQMLAAIARRSAKSETYA